MTSPDARTVRHAVPAVPVPSGPVPDEQTVHLCMSVAVPAPVVWQVLVSPAGVAALLGTGASLGPVGDVFTARDGSHGTLLALRPGRRLDVLWHHAPQAPGVPVRVELVETGGRTRIAVRHEAVPDGTAVADLRRHWHRCLQRVADLVVA